MSPAATAEQWLNTETIQHLTGLSASGVLKRIKNGFYQNVRSVEGLRGGDGGKIVQIALSCLPETLQAVYRAQQAIAAGCTETEQTAQERRRTSSAAGSPISRTKGQAAARAGKARRRMRRSTGTGCPCASPRQTRCGCC